MPKCGRIYYFEGERVEGQMPNTVFIGDLFSKKDNPNDPRKYLFLRKSGGKDANGNWVDIKATKLTFSDGSELDISDRVIVCKLTEGQPQQGANPYPPAAPSGSGSSGSTGGNGGGFDPGL